MNYEKVYNQIITKAKDENRIKGTGIYYEKHHIVPRCMGGLDNDENLVFLTAREHSICHKLLCEIYPNNDKIKYAAWMMCSMKTTTQSRCYVVSSREYEYYKKLISNSKKGKPRSEETKQKIREKRALQTNLRTQPHSEETKRKISETKKGEVRSEEFKTNLSNYWKGKIFSEETKSKISKSLKGKYKGRIPWNKGIPMTDEQKRKISETKKSNKEECKY